MSSRVLTNKDHTRLKKLLREYEAGTLFPKVSEVSTLGGAIPAYVGKLAGTLSPINNITPGHATARIYHLDEAKKLGDQGFTQTVYNLNATTFLAGTFVLVVREPISGQYFVTGAAGGADDATTNCCQCVANASIGIECGDLLLCPRYSLNVGNVLGGEVILNNVDECSYESDTIDRLCSGGTDQYHWEMEVGYGIGETTLQLIYDGSTSGPSGSGSGVSGPLCQEVVLEYSNMWFFDGQCGTPFRLINRNIDNDITDQIKCQFCMKPVETLVNTPCLTAIGEPIGRIAWPVTMTVTITATTIPGLSVPISCEVTWRDAVPVGPFGVEYTGGWSDCDVGSGIQFNGDGALHFEDLPDSGDFSNCAHPCMGSTQCSVSIRCSGDDFVMTMWKNWSNEVTCTTAYNMISNTGTDSATLDPLDLQFTIPWICSFAISEPIGNITVRVQE